MIQQSEGQMLCSDDNSIAIDELYYHISLVAPYLDIIEEMTLIEFLKFHNQFKDLYPEVTIRKVTELIGLEKDADKQIRYYSSGMKQRVKLAQALFFNSKLLLLDEPTSNLDEKGILLYHSLIQDFKKNRLIIVSSNDESEYSFCDDVISILQYKHQDRAPIRQFS
jgi:ABC-type multidrug transport system ATPase subunit